LSLFDEWDHIIINKNKTDSMPHCENDSHCSFYDILFVWDNPVEMID
jgi:hypothetical protein